MSDQTSQSFYTFVSKDNHTFQYYMCDPFYIVICSIKITMVDDATLLYEDVMKMQTPNSYPKIGLLMLTAFLVLPKSF